MPEVSDVDLMELADGTLAEPRRGFVEVELARRPELQQRLEVFCVTGKGLARLFDPVVEASLPSALLETILYTGSASGEARTLHLVAGTARAKGRGWLLDAVSANRWMFSPGVALAAAVVAAVAIGAAFWGLRSDNADGLAAAPLALALEKTPSDRPAGLALAGYGHGVLKPNHSFQHVDGRYCRQFEVSFETGRGLVGYACRVGSGQWRVEKEAEMMPAKVDQPGVIRPSGQHPSVKAIDDAVESVARGDALEADRELDLIRRGWPLDSRQ